MAKHSKSYGRDNSATGSSVSQTSKGQSFVVSLPLTPSEVGSLRRQSKYVNAVSLLGSRTGRNGSSSHSGKVYAMPRDQLFVERREQGDYAVRRGGAERASAVAPTQAEAIAKAKQLNPDRAPLVERVRNTELGRRDKWRKA